MESGNINFRTGSLAAMAAAVLLISLSMACSREGNEQKADGAVPQTQSPAIPEQLRDISPDAFRTSIPVSHYFGNVEVSLYGEYCDHSGRELRSRRYGAVAVSTDESVLRFRSVENLVWYMEENGLDNGDFRIIGIVDFISARQLMRPEELMFHLSRNLPSPGGSWVSAMDPDADPSLLYNIGEAYPGTRHSWEEVRSFLAEQRAGI